ncbi:1-acyl-sn-glycerol-3-phosphate acyltransferase [Nitratireductor kimnyeongensis]|uniref:1-acyl-sn-glycerol-3-phosphate acyltransferase n=1 Tax=Nitratireductor kimnyeongensis TaxID=430679 RepID=A0ABW0T4P1_9HYPH|nr:1-acyl-sn-glycerol-3-phosphate acyltransferase [Nitratireductor kimnyeongensis]QZZ35099.1 2-acyl-glycerophospho-ethanolamine acyltransferase [Nitratireductor kimnyeongensis]
MILITEFVLLVLAVWAAMAGIVQYRRGVSFHQAALHAPLKLLFRISDREVDLARKAETPVIYAVWHQSSLDPATMLALLPDDTLHILDEASAKSLFLEPWRALARTIAFNAHHVFVSRRLVRRLKGNGRLAVYMPDETEPDTKTFRLFRAVARIALKAEAHVVPVYMERRGFVPARHVHTLPPMTIEALIVRSGREDMRASEALFSRMIEVRDASNRKNEV